MNKAGGVIAKPIVGSDNARADQALTTEASTGLTRTELARKLRQFAVTYLGDVPEACDQLMMGDLTLDQRRRAATIKVDSSDSVINIAADPEPEVGLLNMIVVISLQRQLAEARAIEFFGPTGQAYVDATARTEDEIWKLAAQVLDDAEREELRAMIHQWFIEHPDDRNVWWVRFSEFSAYKGRYTVASVGRGIVDVFVPVGDAQRDVGRIGDVSERAVWLAARQAQIIQWRIEMLTMELLSTPEASGLLADSHRAVNAFESLPEAIAAERTAILEALEEQQGELQNTLSSAQATLAETRGLMPEIDTALVTLDATAQTLTQTLEAADAVAARLMPEPDPDAEPGRPFDIREYTQAVQALHDTVAETNRLVTSVNDATADDALNAKLTTVTQHTDRAVADSLDQVQRTGIILILLAAGVFTVGGIVLLFVARALRPSGTPS